MLVVQYTCTTPENARISATKFVNTEYPTLVDWDFFKLRRLAVNLPSPAGQVVWAVRNAVLPGELMVRRRGRYWNVVQEFLTSTNNAEKNS